MLSRTIINPQYIKEYQPPALMYCYNENKMPAPYQTSRREVTVDEIKQIPHIIEDIDTTVKVRPSPFDPIVPYYFEGDINYLLIQLITSIYKNNGIPSSSCNKLICKFGEFNRINICVFKSENGYVIEFIRSVGDRNIFNELKTKILCDVNRNYFSHL